jgi:hypothetical protein
MMQTVQTSETLVNLYQSSRLCNLEDNQLQGLSSLLQSWACFDLGNKVATLQESTYRYEKFQRGYRKREEK